jgi:hypothetical protein
LKSRTQLQLPSPSTSVLITSVTLKIRELPNIMPRNFRESEVDKIQDKLTSIVNSFVANGYSPESVAEAFIREGYCVRDAIDDVDSKRSKRHGHHSGYSSGRDGGYSSGRDGGYSSGRDGGHSFGYDGGYYSERDSGYSSRRDGGYSSGNSSRKDSHGYRAHEHRPGGGYGHSQEYADGAYNSSHTGSRGYRTHDYRPGGYADSSYTAPPPSGTKPEEDLYKLLGISKTATAEQIKSAHRKMCMKYHPDRVTGTREKKAATEHMARINQAHDVLKDEKLRAYYDRTGLIY